MWFPFKKKQRFLALVISDSWAVHQHIKMISEAWHDSEDWSNDDEKSTLPSQELIKK